GADAAGFADVDGEDVAGGGAGELLRVGERVERFVGDDRHAGGAADGGHLFRVAGPDRLLGEGDAEWFEPFDRGDGGRGVAPAAVGVDAELDVGADDRTHGGDAVDVGVRSLTVAALTYADFYFHRA